VAGDRSSQFPATEGRCTE
jgi:thiamine pyrophosphate-dependent acetolactate synthase large subunit-like protein